MADYELGLTWLCKLFVEVKKPSIRIEHDHAPAFQRRRYGYVASLYHLTIYNCRPPISLERNEPHVVRLTLVSYKEYEEKVPNSHKAVYSSTFDRKSELNTICQSVE